MPNVGPGGLAPERRHLPRQQVWDRTTSQGFYTATPHAWGTPLAWNPQRASLSWSPEVVPRTGRFTRTDPLSTQ